MQCNFMESHGFKGRMRFMSIKRKLLAILGTFCAIILLMAGITYFRGSSMLYALLNEAGTEVAVRCCTLRNQQSAQTGHLLIIKPRKVWRLRREFVCGNC